MQILYIRISIRLVQYSQCRTLDKANEGDCNSLAHSNVFEVERICRLDPPERTVRNMVVKYQEHKHVYCTVHLVGVQAFSIGVSNFYLLSFTMALTQASRFDVS